VVLVGFIGFDAEVTGRLGHLKDITGPKFRVCE
jgi:hypothetical protein